MKSFVEFIGWAIAIIGVLVIILGVINESNEIGFIIGIGASTSVMGIWLIIAAFIMDHLEAQTELLTDISIKSQKIMRKPVRYRSK